MENNNGVSNDDNFIAFAFAMVSVVVIAVFLPKIFVLISFGVKAVLSGSKSKKRRDDEEVEANPFFDIVEAALFLPRLSRNVVVNFSAVVEGSKCVLASRRMAALIVPKGLAFVFRPKILLLAVWTYLLVSVMYARLAYDPYSVLGLTTSATVNDVKKAYRTLSRINHPDHNKTAVARVIFAQVKKAFKTITKGEDEQEQDAEQFQVAMALPSFLTSHDHDAAVLLGLLALLIVLPAGLWYRYGRSPQARLSGGLGKLFSKIEELDEILNFAGQPTSHKFVVKRHEAVELSRIFKQVGLGTPNIHDYLLIDNVPSIAEFKTRCMDPERYANALGQMNIAPQQAELLKRYFESNSLPSAPAAKSNRTVSHHAFEAAKFFLSEWFASMQLQIDDVVACSNGWLKYPRASQRLLRLKDELLGALDNIHAGKFSGRDTDIVLDAAEKAFDIAREVPREYQANLSRAMKQMRAQR